MTWANHFAPLWEGAVPAAGDYYRPVIAPLNFGRIPDAAQVVLLQGAFVWTSGVGPLDVWLQTSVDEGLTWSDVANLHYTNATRRSWVSVSNYVTFGAAVIPALNGGLAADAFLSGVVSDLFRMRMTVVGTYSATLRVDLMVR